MPSFPVPEIGAEQIDRAAGIRQLRHLGCEVSVVAKVTSHADRELIEQTAREWGIRLTLVPYKYSNKTLTFKEKLHKFFGKFRNPLYFDGAAYEYAEPEMRAAVEQELRMFNPDVVWFDYTYLWPLYACVRRAKVPIVTQSNNFEPVHFLDEDGWTVINFLKFIPKFIGEWLAVRWSDVVFAVTPKEAATYRRLGARWVQTLPTRGLPKYVAMKRHVIRDHAPLHVFFMGASYKVEHNLAAARHVLQEIAPATEQCAPGTFVFHIFGGKLPKELEQYCDGLHVIYEGYVESGRFDEVIASMDIALVPSLMGAGMQQKVFEPIARGIPTITSPRAIAGYAFVDGREYVGAHTTAEFVQALLELRDLRRRQSLASVASRKAAELFSQTEFDEIVVEGFKKVLRR